MSIQDLGALGELIAAIATVATLVYLAVQLRQNTKALRSATFQQISAQMGQNVESIVQSPDLADLVARLLAGESDFTPADLIRLQGTLVMSMRRLEAVFVQADLQSIDSEMAQGFENSLLPLLLTKVGSKWWQSAQPTFHQAIVTRVNHVLESGSMKADVPSMSVQGDQI